MSISIIFSTSLELQVTYFKSGLLSYYRNGQHDFFENVYQTYKYDGIYSANVFTQRAEDIVKKHDARQPMFLYLAYQSVHGPMEVSTKTKLSRASIVLNVHDNVKQ